MSTSDDLRITAGDFDTKIRACWQELQVDKDFCDVTLACENKHILSHKVIISAFSPVLRNILKLNQSNQPLIYLRGVKYRDLENLLNFIYQGAVYIEKEDLHGFLEVANDLNITFTDYEPSDSNKDNKNSIPDQLELLNILGNDPPSKSGKSIFKKEKDKVNPPTTFSQNVEHINNLHGFIEVAKDLNIIFTDSDLSDRNKESTDLTLDQHELFNNFGNYPHSIFKKEKINEEDKIEPLTNFLLNKEDSNTVKQIPKIPQNEDVDSSRFKQSSSATVSKDQEKRKIIPYTPPSENQNENKIIPYFPPSNYTKNKRSIDSIRIGSYHACNQCDYKATLKATVKVHIKSVHNGKGFYCDKCNFMSDRKSSLKRHIQSVHEQLKNHFCSQCDYKTLQKGNLKTHMENIHNGMSATCDICDKVFSSRSTLLWHNKTVHLGIGYQCSQCNFKATKTSFIRNHRKAQHN